MDEVGFADMIEGFQSITRALRAMAMPVVAAIEGYAVGGGLEIAAACDLRVCAEDTIFFCPEVRLGLLLSNGSSSILPRLIGAGRTRELMLTGRRFDAAWAERAGLVNRVVPPDQLEAAALELAGQVASSSPLTLKIGKQAFYEQIGKEQDAAYDLMGEVMSKNAMTGDAQEGMSAFLEKRDPTWRGE
jgi:enoyl-CoA hydratase/carnithine racemase